ncbi:MAG: hypothetical protein IT198_14680 [Acidimicrobiia bacterium]|nr:hypothetical protein [Acidimicrobiia bacterium]
MTADVGRQGLIGRDEELRLVTGRVGSGRSVAIGGDAGVGKSALLQAVVADLPNSVSVGATESLRSIPLGAFAPILGHETEGLAPLDRLIAALDTLETLVPDAGSGLVLAVDDANSLDDLSAGLLHQIVRRGLATVLVTVRSRAPTPEAIRNLWKDGIADFVALPPLGTEECASLAESLLEGGPVGRRTVAKLFEASGGNALYLRELIAGARESGSLAWTGHVWDWSGPIAPSVALADLVEARLDTLGAQERETFEILALGEPMSLATLEDVTSSTTLDALERRGFISVSEDGRRTVVRVAHPLFTAIARRAVPVRARVSGLLRLAEALERTGARRQDDMMRMAMWRVEARDRSRPDLLATAAETARRGGHARLAVDLAQAAIEGGAGEEARLVLLQASTLLGELESGGPGLDPDRPATEIERVQEARVRADALFVGLGEVDSVEQALDATLNRISEPTLRDELTGIRLAVDLFTAARVDHVITCATDLVENGHGPRARVQAAITLVPALAVAGRPLDAVAVADSVASDIPRSGLPFGDVLVGTTRALALLMAGRIGEAAAVAGIAFDTAVVRESPFEQSGWGVLSGQIALWQGRPRTAVRSFAEALTNARLDLGGFRSWCLADLGRALAWLAEPEPDEAVPRDGTASPHLGLLDVILRVSRAESLVGLGMLTEATDVAAEAADLACRRGQLTYEVLACHLVVRSNGGPEATRAAVESLGSLRDRVQGRLLPNAIDHALALDSGDAAELERVGATWEECGALALAAETHAAAETINTGRHARTAAERCRAAALRCASECEARPRLPAGWRGPSDLTVRERETAMLAARGLTNAEIADRLCVSVRTVHSHLQSVYAKIGTNRREDLARVLDV